MKVQNIVKKLTDKQVEALLQDTKVSKSEKVRQLFDAGFEIKAIAEKIGIRYNFVYNVLQNHVIMNGIAVEKTERVSKRDDIEKLILQGKSLADVSRETKTNYNYIWKISKELKDRLAKETAKEQTAVTVTEQKAEVK